MTQRIWLIRHAATAMTGERWAGWRSDPPLSDAGRARAAALATHLAPVLIRGTIVTSSPSRRAVATARPIADALGTDIELNEDLREVDVGSLDGLTFEETQARHPELAERLLAADRDIDWPDGERAADVRARVARGLCSFVDRTDADTVVVVSHGGVVGEVIVALCGAEAAPQRWLDAGTAVLLVRDGDRWRLGDRIEPERP